MRAKDNPAITAAVDALNEVISTEVREGRFECSMWAAYIVTRSGTSAVGFGCVCPKCTGEIADVAAKQAEKAAQDHAASVH